MSGNPHVIDYGNLFMLLPSPHIIIRPDDDLTIVDQNHAHAAMTFRKREDVIGKPLLEAFPDTSDKFKETGVSDLAESFKRVAHTGQPDSMPVIKYAVQDKNGTFVERWWRATHYPIFEGGDQNKVSLIFQVTEDITSEIKAQEELDLTRSQLDSALAIGLVSAWRWDMSNDLVYGDRNLAKNFGISYHLMSNGLPLQAFIDAIHPDDRKTVAESIMQTVKDGTEYESEYRVVSLDGTVRWVVARGKVEPDVEGAPKYFIGILIDITDRKTAEAEAKESTQLFDALFNSTAVSIATADMSGNVIKANKTFLKQFRYTARELKKGLNTKQLSASGYEKVNRTIYESLRTTGACEPTEKRYVRKDGSEFPALIGCAMLPGRDDQFVAFILDITENERLRRINQIKDDFIALASHQLRTPASSVKQYVGVVLEGYAGELTSSQRDYLTTAQNANNRQLQIINDLLKTAQMDTGNFNLDLAPHNISQIIGEVAEQYRPVLKTKQQELTLHDRCKDVMVPIDAHEIGIALSNLVENASKYSPGGATVRISCECIDDMFQISVSDTGVGIAKADQVKIFDKFTRVDNELSDTVSGNGLGLYWVRRIVDLHKGSLDIDSELGKGTTFILRLPL